MTSRSATTDADETEMTPGRPAVPTTMQAAVARDYGTAEVVAIEEVPTPVPAEGEVLVHVEASSLNALDWHFLTGTPLFMRLMSGLRRPKRIIHGADVAGTVVAVGSGVTRFDVGDAVFGECEGGGFAPYLAVDEDRIVAKPAEVSFEAAGATGVAGLTALQGLRTHGKVEPGDQVLVNGAAGGVGTFAVQIAVVLGAEVTAVCSTGNVEMVRSLGAAHVVDYTREDFVPGGQRFDVVFDNVSNRTSREILSVLGPGARYVAITGPKENRLFGPVPKILGTGLRFMRAEPSFHQFTASPQHDDLTFLGELLTSGKVVPQVHRVVGLDGVADGLAEIGTGHTPAKIVVVPS